METRLQRRNQLERVRQKYRAEEEARRGTVLNPEELEQIKLKYADHVTVWRDADMDRSELMEEELEVDYMVESLGDVPVVKNIKEMRLNIELFFNTTCDRETTPFVEYQARGSWGETVLEVPFFYLLPDTRRFDFYMDSIMQFVGQELPRRCGRQWSVQDRIRYYLYLEYWKSRRFYTPKVWYKAGEYGPMWGGGKVPRI